MNVTFLCPDLRQGGAERQWSILLPALREFGVASRVVTVGEPGHFGRALEESGIEVAAARADGRLDRKGLIRAISLVGHPDVVVSRAVSAHVLASVIARVKRIPHVAAEHTQYDLLPLTRHRAAVMRMIAPQVSHVVAVARTQVGPLLSLGYRASRIQVIPNGVSDEDLQPTRLSADVRAEFGIRPGEKLACVVAALRPEKRIEDFISAVANVRRRGVPLRALIVGDGPARSSLQLLADHMAPGGIAFTGFRSDIGDIVGAVDMVCLSSVHEAASLAVLEAMALGKPVIATDVGATRDIVIDGVTGFVVPPRAPQEMERALITLVGDANRAHAFGEAGLQRHRRHYTANKMARRYAELFHTIAVEATSQLRLPSFAR